MTTNPTGWVHHHRKEEDSAIWDKPPLYLKVWTWLKLNADKDTGVVICTATHIADRVQWVENNRTCVPGRKAIRDILTWLVDEGSLYREVLGARNAKYLRLTLCNYHTYNDTVMAACNANATQSACNTKDRRLVTPNTERNDEACNADSSKLVTPSVQNNTRSTTTAVQQERTDVPAGAGAPPTDDGGQQKTEHQQWMHHAVASWKDICPEDTAAGGFLAKMKTTYGPDPVIEAMEHMWVVGWNPDTEHSADKPKAFRSYLSKCVQGKRATEAAKAAEELVVAKPLFNLPPRGPSKLLQKKSSNNVSDV